MPPEEPKYGPTFKPIPEDVKEQFRQDPTVSRIRKDIINKGRTYTPEEQAQHRFYDSLQNKQIYVDYYDIKGDQIKTITTTDFRRLRQDLRTPKGVYGIPLTIYESTPKGKGRPLATSPVDSVTLLREQRQTNIQKAIEQSTIPEEIIFLGKQKKYKSYLEQYYSYEITEEQFKTKVEEKIIDRYAGSDYYKKYGSFDGKSFQELKKEQPAIEVSRSGKTYIDVVKWQKERDDILGGELTRFFMPAGRWYDWTVAAFKGDFETQRQLQAQTHYEYERLHAKGDYAGIGLHALSSPPVLLAVGKLIKMGMGFVSGLSPTAAKLLTAGAITNVSYNVGKSAYTKDIQDLKQTGVSLPFLLAGGHGAGYKSQQYGIAARGAIAKGYVNVYPSLPKSFKQLRHGGINLSQNIKFKWAQLTNRGMYKPSQVRDIYGGYTTSDFRPIFGAYKGDWNTGRYVYNPKTGNFNRLASGTEYNKIIRQGPPTRYKEADIIFQDKTPGRYLYDPKTNWVARLAEDRPINRINLPSNKVILGEPKTVDMFGRRIYHMPGRGPILWAGEQKGFSSKNIIKNNTINYESPYLNKAITKSTYETQPVIKGFNITKMEWYQKPTPIIDNIKITSRGGIGGGYAGAYGFVSINDLNFLEEGIDSSSNMWNDKNINKGRSGIDNILRPGIGLSPLGKDIMKPSSGSGFKPISLSNLGIDTNIDRNIKNRSGSALALSLGLSLKQQLKTKVKTKLDYELDPFNEQIKLKKIKLPKDDKKILSFKKYKPYRVKKLNVGYRFRRIKVPKIESFFKWGF